MAFTTNLTKNSGSMFMDSTKKWCK